MQGLITVPGNRFPTLSPTMRILPTSSALMGKGRKGCHLKNMGKGRGRRCFCNGKMVKTSRCK